jgi:hypothetical protein
MPGEEIRLRRYPRGAINNAQTVSLQLDPDQPNMTKHHHSTLNVTYGEEARAE